jgi:SAM-dependent methyltransferase
MQDILDGYAAAATPDFIAAYDALSPERLYEHVIDLLPGSDARVADIGAGTGRDAAWLADRGQNVVAVEPVRELREAGRKLHRSKGIVWLDDRLPHLKEVRSYRPFDLVILSAVWQHLTDEHRVQAMPNLATITAPGGIMILSLRHGPGGEGRRVFPVSPDVTIRVADHCGLQLIRRRESGSVQTMNQAMGVCWTWLAFEKIR